MTVSHVGSTFSWRGPGSFLKAVQELIATDMIPSDRISLRFVGSGPTFQIEDSRCSGIVENLGHVAHDAAIAELRAADVLVLFNTEESNILAKTFEYLASGRPILALTPPGPTADLLRDNGVEVILDPEDATGIERALYEFHARWQKGALLSRPTGDLADKYSRRAAARRLGSVFDSLVPRRQT
jgi:glycosyltransferase involved in cell wall biosynthesis